MTRGATRLTTSGALVAAVVGAGNRQSGPTPEMQPELLLMVTSSPAQKTGRGAESRMRKVGLQKAPPERSDQSEKKEILESFLAVHPSPRKTDTLTHMHVYSQTHPHHTLIHTHTHTLTLSPKYTHSHTLTDSDTLPNTHTLTYNDKLT